MPHTYKERCKGWLAAFFLFTAKEGFQKKILPN